ncbi:MAG TPA: GatB/YqeY domain-containing protein [Candidatus Saccharimonadales bacterium]
MLKQRIEQDLKKALLAGDKGRAMTLRSLKSVILYAEVAQGIREEGLDDDAIVILLSKEAKKRQESADFFVKGGSEDRAATELAEKKTIEEYLPKQLSDVELISIVDTVIAELGVSGPQSMGQVIGQVKQKTGGQADGSRIAQTVKQRLN